MNLLDSPKRVFAPLFGLGGDALHIYLGLGAMLLAALVLKRPLSDWRPLAAALLASVAGELWQVIDSWTHGNAARFAPAWRDVWHTAFWPLILFLLARFTSTLR